MPENDPSRPSAPMTIPKSSGAGPYIAAIVVLIAMIGGMIWWKFGRSPVEPKPVASQRIPTAEPTPPSPLIDIPAPPELDAAADAESDAAAPKNAPVNLCAGPCSGDAPALRSALASAGGASRGCYERALRTNPTLQGRLIVSVRVASNGNVCSASISQDDLHAADVSSCVLGLFRSKHFPSPTGGKCADVDVPLNFTPREKK